MIPFRKSFIFVLLRPSLASGFLFENLFTSMEMKPDLMHLTENQNSKLLNIQLHLSNEDGVQMAVTDLVVELHHDLANYEHTMLPGADGRHRKLSTGHRHLDVISQGRFIDTMGTQHVKMNKGCWEMCWRSGKPAGTLVCGFDLPEEYRRNDVALPKGELYLSFPLWTREGLQIGWDEKNRIELEMEKYLQERDEELAKFDRTSNPIMKALHIRNAFAALDKYNNIDHTTLETIPSDDQTISIQDDLFLCYKGLIWIKEPSDQGHTLIGHAEVASGSQKNFNRHLMP